MHNCDDLLCGCYSDTLGHLNVDKINEDCQEGLFFGKCTSMQFPTSLDYYFPYYLYCTSVHKRKTKDPLKSEPHLKTER